MLALKYERVRNGKSERDSDEDQTVLFNLWRFVNIFRRSFYGSCFNSIFIGFGCRPYNELENRDENL